MRLLAMVRALHDALAAAKPLCTACGWWSLDLDTIFSWHDGTGRVATLGPRTKACGTSCSNYFSMKESSARLKWLTYLNRVRVKVISGVRPSRTIGTCDVLGRDALLAVTSRCLDRSSLDFWRDLQEVSCTPSKISQIVSRLCS